MSTIKDEDINNNNGGSLLVKRKIDSNILVPDKKFKKTK